MTGKQFFSKKLTKIDASDAIPDFPIGRLPSISFIWGVSNKTGIFIYT